MLLLGRRVNWHHVNDDEDDSARQDSRYSHAQKDDPDLLPARNGTVRRVEHRDT